MKLRHAAALASIGWYLMVPFAASDGTPDTGAPLSQWIFQSSFNSARECEQAADKLRAKFAVSGPLKDPHVLKALEWSQAIHCVATDDPRLAK
jgi:hypothetical protein